MYLSHDHTLMVQRLNGYKFRIGIHTKGVASGGELDGILDLESKAMEKRYP